MTCMSRSHGCSPRLDVGVVVIVAGCRDVFVGVFAGAACDHSGGAIRLVFRQSIHMAWGPVFDRMAAELEEMVPRRVRTPWVQAPVAPGELIDKITILEIKSQRIADQEKLANVRAELTDLTEARDRAIFDGGKLAPLVAELKSINESLWQIEDDIRRREREGDFGPRFIELARSVYDNKDHRALVKRRINERLGAKIIEEKSYGANGLNGERRL
jgi:Family of unknown function (DUF6165)